MPHTVHWLNIHKIIVAYICIYIYLKSNVRIVRSKHDTYYYIKWQLYICIYNVIHILYVYSPFKIYLVNNIISCMCKHCFILLLSLIIFYSVLQRAHNIYEKLLLQICNMYEYIRCHNYYILCGASAKSTLFITAFILWSITTYVEKKYSILAQ